MLARVCVGRSILVGLFHSNHMLYMLLNKPALSKGGGSLNLAKRDLFNSNFMAFTLCKLSSLILNPKVVQKATLNGLRTRRMDHTSPITFHFTFTSLCDL